MAAGAIIVLDGSGTSQYVKTASGAGSIGDPYVPQHTVDGTINVTTVTTVTAVTAISNALPAGTNAIGKLAANSGVDIGDVDITSIAAGTNTIGGTRDAGAAWTSVFGVSGAAVVSANITSATAITDAPTSGQKIIVDDIVVSTDTAMNILFEEETSGTDIFKVFLPANGTLQITPRDKVKLATADKKLTAKGSATGNVGITVTYHSES